MVTVIDQWTQMGELAGEAAALAELVRASVVVVRGSQHGGGSGVVWNGRGLVVTNHHVVPGERAEVVLSGGPRVAARVVARATGLDLVALQLEGPVPASGLVPAAIGDSTHLRVGELVVAVGNPLGERNAVTLGVVSGTGPAAWLGRTRDVIQVAITLRPGNSGGALADIQGRVVGIPHMVVGGGLALAVPSHVVERFLLGERARGPRLGLHAQWARLSPSVAARHGLSMPAGLLVVGLEPNSPAERAGLTLGDLLVGAIEAGNGLARGPIDLLARLEGMPAGRPVRLAVIRAGDLHWFEVTPER